MHCEYTRTPHPAQYCKAHVYRIRPGVTETWLAVRLPNGYLIYYRIDLAKEG